MSDIVDKNGFETLDVPYRGTRDYLQSADLFTGLFEAITRRFGADSVIGLRVKFSDISKTLPQFRIVNEDFGFKPTQQNPIVGSVRLSDGKTHDLEVVHGTKSPNKRLEGDEAAISEHIIVSGLQAQLKPAVKAKLAEQIVFASKKMHYKAYPPGDKKWMVVEINVQFDKVAKDWEMLSIKLDMERNETVTSSSIYLDNVKIGAVRYVKVDYPS